jgi:RNase P/RNase MRP subunit p30
MHGRLFLYSNSRKNVLTQVQQALRSARSQRPKISKSSDANLMLELYYPAQRT